MNNQDFANLDVRELIFNVWAYNEDRSHLDMCSTCQALHQSAKYALKQKWKPKWGDLDYFIRHVLLDEKFYIDVRNYVIYGDNEPTNFMIKILKKIK